MVKLDIGSGGRSILGEGWLGVDAYAPFAEIQADMGNLPYEDDEVEEIYSSHSLEHTPKNNVIPVLYEWYRVLRPSGRLTLLVPNLEWVCKHWLSHPTTGWDMDTIFGNQNNEGEFHKTGFNYPILREYLTRVGFIIDSMESIDSHGQETIMAKAHKADYGE